MLGRIRKFSTSIYSKVFLGIVAIPFIFWGMGDLFSGGNINTIVKIGKEKIHTQEFINYLRTKSLSTDQLNDSQLIQQMLYGFIGEMLILKEIDDLDLKLSDSSLAKTIRSQKILFTTKTNLTVITPLNSMLCDTNWADTRQTTHRVFLSLS